MIALNGQGRGGCISRIRNTPSLRLCQEAREAEQPRHGWKPRPGVLISVKISASERPMTDLSSSHSGHHGATVGTSISLVLWRGLAQLAATRVEVILQRPINLSA